MSIVSNALQIAHAAQRVLHGEAITYARGESISIEISDAVRGSTNWDTDAPSPGSRIGDRSVDWLLTVSDLTDDDGNELEPQRGDTITTERGEVFRVMPFMKESPLWQWHDRNGQTVRRVFTKERN
jgi:hypothetical protein